MDEDDDYTLTEEEEEEEEKEGEVFEDEVFLQQVNILSNILLVLTLLLLSVSICLTKAHCEQSRIVQYYDNFKQGSVYD